MTLDHEDIQAIAEAVVLKLAGVQPAPVAVSGVEVYQIRTAASLDLAAARARAAAKRGRRTRNGSDC